MAESLFSQLCEAIGLDPSCVTRLIIDTGDAADNALPTVYATLILDENALRQVAEVWQGATEDKYVKRYTAQAPIIDADVEYVYDDIEDYLGHLADGSDFADLDNDRYWDDDDDE